MAYNASDAFNSALSLFSSLYQDMNPTDLPEGLSPDNQDVWFLPGSVSTRPAMNKLLSVVPSPGARIMSAADFPTPAGDFATIFLDSAGNLKQNLVSTGTTTTIDTVTPSVQFKSESAFEKQWFAFFGQALAGFYSMNPFVGVDVPRFYDGQNVYRVTSDAPGINPVFSNLQTQPIALVQSSTAGSPLTVTSVLGAGLKTITIKTAPGKPSIIDQYWTTLVYTCSAPVPATWLNQSVTTTGLTGSLANLTSVIIAVSGSTFTISFIADTQIHLTAQSGTASLAGNYLVRSSNIVTAFVGSSQPSNLTAGLFAKIINSNGTAINGPNWTISSIVRDGTGLVTITVSTQLTNLAVGAQLFISATDTTDFPASLQNVFQVISATGGSTTFTISNSTWGNGAIASSTGGSVYQIWSGTFQIQSIAQDPTNGWYITYFQLGPDSALASTGGTPQIQIQAQIAPGPRSAVLMFKSINGAITAPSIPIQLSVTGGTSLLLAQQIPLGPFGTAQRVIALTPAFGSSYYYATPAIVPSISGLPPVLSVGTIIPDNTTTSQIIDFADAQLVAGTQIDVAGNNLFNQVVLAPCLGVIEYQGHMCWWGEINNIKNLQNMGFDGGYNPPSGVVNTSGTSVAYVSGALFINNWIGFQIQINGVVYTVTGVSSQTSLTLTSSAGNQTGVAFTTYNPAGGVTVPPGWSGVGSTGGSPTLTAYSLSDLGFAYEMQSAGGTNDCMISQPCYQDYYGAPILQPLTAYVFRLRALNQSGIIGNLVADLYSPTLGILAAAPLALSALPNSIGWVQAAFNSITPASIPSDALLRIYMQNTTAGSLLLIDEIEIINANQPVLFNQMRVSYFDNPFGYDSQTGVIGFDTSESLAGAFKQRGYLYALSDQSQFQTQNNGSTEPNGWPVSNFAQNCGCAGPCAVDVGAGVAMWAGRYGHQLFTGDTPKKISQEIQPTWDRINWAAQTSIWLVHDPVQRIVYTGLPLDSATAPSIIQPMSYRSVDSVYNVPDPLHISYSGKLICSDLCRKSTLWNITANCGAMVTRNTGQGNAKQMIFGAGNGTSARASFGNLYYLNFNKFTDDDYGRINSYFITSFFWNHDTEQNVPPLGLHRKIYEYLSLYITGVGNVQVTPLVDNLNNPWSPTSTTWDAINQVWKVGAVPNPLPAYQLTNGVLTHDLEWGMNVIGERVAFKISVSPLAGQTDAYFNLQHLVIAGRADKVFPVRGAFA